MPQSSMIERLNTATRVHHVEADADFDLLFGPVTVAGHYIQFLVREYGFDVALEAALAATPGLRLVVDLPVRRRSLRAAQDLLALGLVPAEIDALPICTAVPAFTSVAEALGWMYVAERPTLAHPVIRRHLLTRLPREMNKASAYLSTYAGVIGRRWRELGQVLDVVAADPTTADRVVAAAHDAFRTQRRWIQHEHATPERAIA